MGGYAKNERAIIYFTIYQRMFTHVRHAMSSNCSMHAFVVEALLEKLLFRGCCRCYYCSLYKDDLLKLDIII